MRILSSALVLTLTGILSASSALAAEKPNIVLLYIDDWAWNGSPARMDESMPNSGAPILSMPHVEQLAAQGMKFRNAYGAPQCAPARVCVQTGQAAPRSGYTLVLNGGETEDYYDTRSQSQGLPMIPNGSDKSLDTDALTIPKALKPLGYQSAHVGKWHMYADPSEAGYAVHDGETTNNEGNTISADLKKGEPKPRQLPKDLRDPKLMVSMTDKALGFMEDQVAEGNPFYLQVSHYAMHSGPETLAETQEKYENHPAVKAYFKKEGIDPDTLQRKRNPANWFGMGDNLDTQIGRVLEKLEALGIADSTYVVLVSDNGYRHSEFMIEPGFSQPLHGHKWWAWEGGIRVPMIVRGPGIEPGSTFRGNVVNYDFLPTFLDWAGGDPEALPDIDGVSLAAYMEGAAPDDDFLNRNLYFHVPHYRNMVPHSAVVSGDHKVMHFYEEPDVPMLFDLSEDLGERRNIAKQHPETHQKLMGEMMDYMKGVGARFPKPNPDYDPKKDRHEKIAQMRQELGAFQGKRPLEEDERPEG